MRFFGFIEYKQLIKLFADLLNCSLFYCLLWGTNNIRKHKTESYLHATYIVFNYAGEILSYHGWTFVRRGFVREILSGGLCPGAFVRSPVFHISGSCSFFACFYYLIVCMHCGWKCLYHIAGDKRKGTQLMRTVWNSLSIIK